MTQATTRPTAAQRQRNQAQADRKAAALARRAERGNGIETVTQQNTRLYANTETTIKPVKTTQAAIVRRLAGRLELLKALGRGYNDAHLFLLEAVVANYTNQQLKDKQQGQDSFIGSLDAAIANDLGLDQLRIEGLTDDQESGKSKNALFMFVEDGDVAFVKDYVNQLVIDRKNA